MTDNAIISQNISGSISSLALNLHIFIPDEAFRSWLNSTRRLLKTINCPICNRRAKCRGGYILCNHCNRGWPIDDISDLITDIETIGEIYKREIQNNENIHSSKKSS